ncbi:MAG: hypothetical protein IKE61_06100 [Coriobacteriales bacterium]|nr:hypothetical protein [Coriobacteriales bacterium]
MSETNDRMDILCPTCGEVSLTKEDLEGMTILKDGALIMTFSCPTCGRAMAYEIPFADDEDSDFSPLLDSMCELTFVSRDELIEIDFDDLEGELEELVEEAEAAVEEAGAELEEAEAAVEETEAIVEEAVVEAEVEVEAEEPELEAEEPIEPQPEVEAELEDPKEEAKAPASPLDYGLMAETVAEPEELAEPVEAPAKPEAAAEPDPTADVRNLFEKMDQCKDVSNVIGEPTAPPKPDLGDMVPDIDGEKPVAPPPVSKVPERGVTDADGNKVILNYSTTPNSGMVVMGYQIRPKERRASKMTLSEFEKAQLEYFHRQLEQLGSVDEAIDEIDSGYRPSEDE